MKTAARLVTSIKRVQSTGFTLVELMVVISIIAILATIGLAIYSQAQQSARDGRRIGDLGEAQKALEQFYAINKGYVSLTSTVVNNVDLSSLNNANGDLSPYFQNNAPPDDPNIPLSGSNYKYFSCGSNPAAQYIICAKLENCGSRCNMSALPADGCGAIGVPAPAQTFFCYKSISN